MTYVARMSMVCAAALMVGACQSKDKTTPQNGADTVHHAVAASPQCDAGNGGITLPAGFCASVFADNVGGARHVVVSPDGKVYAALITGQKIGDKADTTGAGILVLADTNHDGLADQRAMFGHVGGTGIAIHDGGLYVDAVTAIVRYTLPTQGLVPQGAVDTIVRGLPANGHNAHNIAFTANGGMLVNIGSHTNACQQQDRAAHSPGIDPCPELATRGGIWLFDAKRKNQTEATGRRYVTGLRNGMGIALNPADSKIWGTQHGRDQLFENWPELFDAAAGAEQPAEELVQENQGDDFGWPYCYYDQTQQKLVLAPEYGGDRKKTERCDQKKAPALAFPGHWAPMSLTFYTGSMFPEHYHNGAFIAFHGSWNRTPTQAGYRVVFVPFTNGVPTGTYEDFATGFARISADSLVNPGKAAHRPVGIAIAPDGSMYITDDQNGRIWRVIKI
jgi:glucose/arabinose dehydrogenase